MSIERALVIGGCGGFGRCFTRLLNEADVAVTTVDVVPGADLQADITEDMAPVRAALSVADVIILCVPEDQTIDLLAALDQDVSSEQLVVDICSVKSRVGKVAEEMCKQAEYLSLHPMFGPDRPLQDSNAVVIPIRRNDVFEKFLPLLAAAGLNIIESTVDEHDRVTSLVQVIPHLLLINFAKVRAEADIPEDLVQAFATPIFKDLEKVSQGLVHENPALYHNIQTANPNGEAARQLVLEALLSTKAVLEQEQSQATEELFSAVRRD